MVCLTSPASASSCPDKLGHWTILWQSSVTKSMRSLLSKYDASPKSRLSRLPCPPWSITQTPDNYLDATPGRLRLGPRLAAVDARPAWLLAVSRLLAIESQLTPGKKQMVDVNQRIQLRSRFRFIRSIDSASVRLRKTVFRGAGFRDGARPLHTRRSVQGDN